MQPTLRPALRTAAVAALLAGALALTACTPSSPSPSSSKPAAGAGSTPSSGSTPDQPATPTAPPTPVTLTCDQIVTPDQMYAFNPNFGADPGYSPAAGSLEKQIAEWKGATCAWLNQTSGDVIQISVARPPSTAMESLKNAAVTSGTPVPTYGVPPAVEGYFTTGKSGLVQIFRGSYWIVAESPAFFEPGDAAPLMENVLGNIPNE